MCHIDLVTNTWIYNVDCVRRGMAICIHSFAGRVSLFWDSDYLVCGTSSCFSSTFNCVNIFYFCSLNHRG